MRDDLLKSLTRECKRGISVGFFVVQFLPAFRKRYTNGIDRHFRPEGI